VRALYEMECAEAEKAAAREKSLGSVDARTGKAYDDMGWEVQQPEKDAARRPKTQGTRPSKIKFAEVAGGAFGRPTTVDPAGAVGCLQPDTGGMWAPDSQRFGWTHERRQQSQLQAGPRLLLPFSPPLFSSACFSSPL